MKLWLLRPKPDIPEENDPWEPWYDKAFGFVVRAESEERARTLANDSGGNETGEITTNVYRMGGDPWLDPDFSTCVELTNVGVEAVIICDLRSA